MLGNFLIEKEKLTNEGQISDEFRGRKSLSLILPFGHVASKCLYRQYTKPDQNPPNRTKLRRRFI